jgi:hypothetical protein
MNLIKRIGIFRLSIKYTLITMCINAILYGLTFVIYREASIFFMIATMYQFVKFLLQIRNKKITIT